MMNAIQNHAHKRFMLKNQIGPHDAINLEKTAADPKNCKKS